MRLPVPHLKISITYKKRHILEILGFLILVYLGHVFGLYHLIWQFGHGCFSIIDEFLNYLFDVFFKRGICGLAKVFSAGPGRLVL